MIESFRYLPESIYNFSAVQNSLVGDLSRPASSTTAFTIDFQNAFENSYYVSASLHESSNGRDPDDSLISSPLLQEYIATQNIQQETEGTNFPPKGPFLYYVRVFLAFFRPPTYPCKEYTGSSLNAIFGAWKNSH